MRLQGTINLPPDKSITHRAFFIASIAQGRTRIINPLFAEDTLTTLKILAQLGVDVKKTKEEIEINGKGISNLREAQKALDCGNSGTTARLLMGLLTGLPYEYTLIGDASLSKRPMKRVVSPLSLLNSKIILTNDDYLPAKILPTTVKSNTVSLPTSSAQVKSAIMLAALKCTEETVLYLSGASRNHTELMLSYYGADISFSDQVIKISGKNELQGREITIPGDISSAAFFIVASLIVPDSEIILSNCGLNPTRTGILTVLNQIGAYYEILNQRIVNNELVGDVLIRFTKTLQPFIIGGDLIPLLIDEIPILALLATQIPGTSIIKDAKDARVKESDRLRNTYLNLRKLGCQIEELPDGFVITGKTELQSNVVDSFNDHRLSMMLKVAKLLNHNIEILNDECDKISYPNFEKDLSKLVK